MNFEQTQTTELSREEQIQALEATRKDMLDYGMKDNDPRIVKIDNDLNHLRPEVVEAEKIVESKFKQMDGTKVETAKIMLERSQTTLAKIEKDIFETQQSMLGLKETDEKFKAASGLIKVFERQRDVLEQAVRTNEAMLNKLLEKTS
jgi:hypothetical protein